MSGPHVASSNSSPACVCAHDSRLRCVVLGRKCVWAGLRILNQIGELGECMWSAAVVMIVAVDGIYSADYCTSVAHNKIELRTECIKPVMTAYLPNTVITNVYGI